MCSPGRFFCVWAWVSWRYWRLALHHARAMVSCCGGCVSALEASLKLRERCSPFYIPADASSVSEVQSDSLL